MVGWGMTTDTRARADYTDTFGTTSRRSHTAEQWARAAFASTPAEDWKAQAVWRGALLFRLAPLDAPGHVAGWRVLEVETERLVVAAEGPLHRAWLTWHADDDGVRVTTEVQHRHAAARAQWAALGAVHRWAVPRVLTAARGRLEG